MLLIDFAMNCSHETLDQTQQQFFVHMQTTLFIISVYRRMELPTEREEKAYKTVEGRHIYVSNDGKHDAHFVRYCSTDCVQFYLRMLGREGLAHVRGWSDNCCQQFKCKENFGGFVTLPLRTASERGVPGPTMSADFSVEGHGKAASDAQAAHSKSWLRDRVLYGQVKRHENAKHVYKELLDNLARLPPLLEKKLKEMEGWGRKVDGFFDPHAFFVSVLDGMKERGEEAEAKELRALFNTFSAEEGPVRAWRYVHVEQSVVERDVPSYKALKESSNFYSFHPPPPPTCSHGLVTQTWCVATAAVLASLASTSVQ